MKRAIYIPGLGREQFGMTVKAYAQRMKKALDEQNPDSANTYRLEAGEREYDGEGNIAETVSIFESGASGEKEIYRFYEFQYSAFLTGGFREANILRRFSFLLLLLGSRSWSVLKSLMTLSNQIDYMAKLQALYFALIYCALALYLVFLVPSLLALLISFGGGIEQLQPVVGKLEAYETAIKAIVASFSAVMLFTPGSRNLFSEIATEYLAANQYLSFGERRLLISGKLNRLLEVIAEEASGEQAQTDGGAPGASCESQIEIHAYSFGSVMALDTIFPYEAPPSLRVRTCISRLVTIGCPFDFIEIYWANYFANRQYQGLALTEWRNISSDMDVLSSRFDGFDLKRRHFVDAGDFWERMGAIDTTYNMVNPRQVSVFQYFLFYGLKAHQMYWDRHTDSKSCLTLVV